MKLIEERDVQAVADQMRSQWIGRCECVRQLELLIASWVSAKYAVVLGSGTAALTAALRWLPGTEVNAARNVCPAVRHAIRMSSKQINRLSKMRISVYPERGGIIEDFARHFPHYEEVQLTGRYGVFSFGALKDVTGGIGGCLVSNTPFPEDVKDWIRISPLSDINAALILSQLFHYEGHYTYRQVADGRLWKAPA